MRLQSAPNLVYTRLGRHVSWLWPRPEPSSAGATPPRLPLAPLDLLLHLAPPPGHASGTPSPLLLGSLLLPGLAAPCTLSSLKPHLLGLLPSVPPAGQVSQAWADTSPGLQPAEKPARPSSGSQPHSQERKAGLLGRPPKVGPVWPVRPPKRPQGSPGLAATGNGSVGQQDHGDAV